MWSTTGDPLVAAQTTRLCKFPHLLARPWLRRFGFFWCRHGGRQSVDLVGLPVDVIGILINISVYRPALSAAFRGFDSLSVPGFRSIVDPPSARPRATISSLFPPFRPRFCATRPLTGACAASAVWVGLFCRFILWGSGGHTVRSFSRHILMLLSRASSRVHSPSGAKLIEARLLPRQKAPDGAPSSEG